LQADAELLGITLSAKPKPEAFEVLACNWDAVMFFMQLDSCWQFSAVGSWLGLDYAAVDVPLRYTFKTEKKRGKIFKKIVVMERAALEIKRDVGK